MRLPTNNCVKNYIVDKITDCWLYQGIINKNGYGFFHNSLNRVVYAHRYYYEQKYGLVKKNYHIHHKCKNRKCVNPEHLVMLTKSEHSKIDSINRYKTHCPQGHEYIKENTYYINDRRYCKICMKQHRRLIRIVYKDQIGNQL